MARIRTVKPEFWTSEQVVECSPIARLLFVGLWTFADDRGVIPRRLRSIKMQVFPGDDFSLDQVDDWLSELEAGGLLLRFEHDGSEYLAVTGWNKHQRIDKPSYKHPAPPEFPEQSANESKTKRRPVKDRSTTVRRPFDEC